jgi:hypothetical protein
MRLRQDEVLFLEGAEDCDVHSTEGVTATQVKDTAGSGTLTLRSGDAVAAINNFWRHQQNNPDKEVSFDFSQQHCRGERKGATLALLPPESNTSPLQSGTMHSRLSRLGHFCCL